jgi:hypothetical protein
MQSNLHFAFQTKNGLHFIFLLRIGKMFLSWVRELQRAAASLHPLQDHPYKATKWGGVESSRVLLACYYGCCSHGFCFLLHIACYGN